MITAEELLAHPVNLLAHIRRISPSITGAAERKARELAIENEIFESIANLPAGTEINLGSLGQTNAAIAAKRRAREAGLMVRSHKGMAPMWRRTSKGQT
jgi:hypothetical protein